MDISTGRCPTKKIDCDCTKVCARLYGEQVRKLRRELLDCSPDEFVRKTKEFHLFVRKAGFTKTHNDIPKNYPNPN